MSLFLGIRAKGTETVHSEPHPRIQVKLLSGKARGLYLKCHYAFFALWTLYWTWRWRPDWLYVSDPSACPIASLVKVFSKVRILYHEHDSPDPQAVSRGWMRLVYRARRSLAQRAALCVLPNSHRMESFQTDMQRRDGVYCVCNYPARSEISPQREAASSRKMTFLCIKDLLFLSDCLYRSSMRCAPARRT